MFFLLHSFSHFYGQEIESPDLGSLSRDSLDSYFFNEKQKADKLSNQGKLYEAEAIYGRILQESEKLPYEDIKFRFGLYAEYSFLYSQQKLADPQQQLYYLEKAKSVLVEDSVSTYILGFYYLDLASLKWEEGDYEEMMGYVRKATQVFESRREESIAEIGLSDAIYTESSGKEWKIRAYFAMKEEEKMLAAYQELLDFASKYKEVDLSFTLGTSAFRIGRYYQSNNLEKASFYFDRSIRLATTQNEKLYSYICKGLACLDAGKPQKALQIVNILKKFEKISPLQELNILEIAARTYGELGDKNRLVQTTNRALSLMNTQDTKIDVLDFKEENFTYFDRLKYPVLLTQFASFLELVDDEKLTTTAQQLYAICLDVFSKRLDHQPVSNHLQTYHLIQSRILPELILAEASQAEKESLLNKMEMIETRARFNQLLFNRALAKRQSSQDSLFAAENDIRKKITVLKRNQAKEDSLSEQQIFNLELELDAIQEQLSQESKAIYGLANASVDDISFPDLPNTLILKFMITRGQLYRVQLLNKVVEVKDLGKFEPIEQKVDSFLTLLKNPSQREALDQLGSDLYQDLMKKLDFPLHTVIVADQSLLYLPFELLKTESDYLLRKTAISYAKGFMYIQQDLFPQVAHTQSVSFFAPEYSKYEPSKDELAIRGEAYDLSGAKEEVESLSKLTNGRIFSKEKASKEQFFNLAGDYAVIHIAGHAYLNDEDPELSNLVFSDQAEDNKLYISELYGFKSNANLAVLSACNSGVGGYKDGKGMVSLSEAFMYAGIPATVSSLWSAPDQATKEIMISFYQYLKEGKPKSIALQQAKLDYLDNTSNPKLAHPYYWAPFVLYGNDAPIDLRSGGMEWLYWPMGLAVILVVGMLFYIGRRKNA
ncbi:MAG: CHAT domain-containing protein [Bacteroidota bacterium]